MWLLSRDNNQIPAWHLSKHSNINYLLKGQKGLSKKKEKMWVAPHSQLIKTRFYYLHSKCTTLQAMQLLPHAPTNPMRNLQGCGGEWRVLSEGRLRRRSVTGASYRGAVTASLLQDPKVVVVTTPRHTAEEPNLDTPHWIVEVYLAPCYSSITRQTPCKSPVVIDSAVSRFTVMKQSSANPKPRQAEASRLSSVLPSFCILFIYRNIMQKIQ